MENNRNLYSDAKVISYEEGDSSLERIPIVFPDDIGDISHTLLQGDTLLTIAHRAYKDSRKWWKIADRNNLDDPFYLTIGSEIIIPNPKKN